MSAGHALGVRQALQVVFNICLHFCSHTRTHALTHICTQQYKEQRRKYDTEKKNRKTKALVLAPVGSPPFPSPLHRATSFLITVNIVPPPLHLCTIFSHPDNSHEHPCPVFDPQRDRLEYALGEPTMQGWIKVRLRPHASAPLASCWHAAHTRISTQPVVVPTGVFVC